MNLILFDADEPIDRIERADYRARHIIDILKLSKGDMVRVGRINRSSGFARIVAISPRWIRLRPESDCSSPAPRRRPRAICVIGHPRPPVAARLIRDLTALGIDRIIFTLSELTEKSYIHSKIWEQPRLRASLINGAMQAARVYIPSVDRTRSLRDALQIAREAEAKAPSARVAALFDTSPEASPLSGLTPRLNDKVESLLVIVGPERGWIEKERAIIKN